MLKTVLAAAAAVALIHHAAPAAPTHAPPPEREAVVTAREAGAVDTVSWTVFLAPPARRSEAEAAFEDRRARYLPLAASVRPDSLPLKLLDAVISKESKYQSDAVGSAGEIGLMQVKPATARLVAKRLGLRDVVDLAGPDFVAWLFEPENNLRIGLSYLAYCNRRAAGSLAETISCYQAGPGRMTAWQTSDATRAYLAYVERRIASN
jgi:soluble lytic murein transglycosylase-like protein